MCIRQLFALTLLLLGAVQVMGQFANPFSSQAYAGVSGQPAVSGASANVYPQAVPTKHPIKEALAQAMVINAEAKANKYENNVAPASVVPAAKTKNFAYTSISVPSSSPSGKK